MTRSGMGSSKGLPIFCYIHNCVRIRACDDMYAYICIIQILFVSLIYNQKDMKLIREVIKERNELLMNMTFSRDEKQVKVLWKKVEALDYEIRCMTLN